MKHIPYEYMTYEKHMSLGETMTIKKALNLWWNSVRIKLNDNLFIIYRCYDKTYELGGLDEELEITENELLKRKITLDSEYYEDSDNYPVINAVLI